MTRQVRRGEYYTLFRHHNWFCGYDSWSFRPWMRLVFLITALGAVGWFVWLVLDLLLWRHGCYAPYHLVYTGTAPELVGKVVVNEDQYACVAN